MNKLFNMGPVYSKEDLINNYQKKENEIQDLKNYFESITPPNSSITIEFEKKKITIFHVGKNDTYESNWDPKDLKIDSLLKILHWDESVLNEVKNKLNIANCIGISNGSTTKVYWQRSGMGMYSYIIHDQNLSKQEIERFDAQCDYIFLKDNIGLKYGGCAFCSDCFPD